MKKLPYKELALWKKVADTCTPLHEKKIALPDVEFSKIMENVAVRNRVVNPTPKDAPKIMEREFHTDRKVLKKIKKGKVFIDARLDLHGMTQVDAFVALKQFILSASSHGKKNTLIITGKGSGILQTALPRWLELSELKPYVSWYEIADIQHGGSGAFYVVLRKSN